MRNRIIHLSKALALVLAWALWVTPVMADESARAKEGSKSKEVSQGSPHGVKEGSKSKHGSTYKQGSPHGGKSYGGGAHSKKYGGSYGGHRGYGRSGHHGHKTDPFKHVLRFAHRLGLTEAQRTEIKHQHFEFKKIKIQLHAEHRIAHLEMDMMVHSGELNESGLRALADKISAIKSKSVHAMVEAKITLLRILSPEQRKMVNRLHSGH